MQTSSESAQTLVDLSSDQSDRLGEPSEGKKDGFVLAHRIEVGEPELGISLSVRREGLRRASELFNNAFFKRHSDSNPVNGESSTA